MGGKTESGSFAGTASARIAGVMAAVPSNEWANSDVLGAVEIEKMTGVKTRRRVYGHQNAETMCVAAAQKLLDDLGWKASQIDVLVFVTQTPARAMPATAFDIQQALGLSSSCLVVPVNWSCAGWVAGMWTAMRLRCRGSRALLLVGDNMTSILDPHDRATAPLFGDAGTATALDDGPYSHRFVFGSTGLGNNALSQNHGSPLHMDGGEVFSFTLNRVPPMVNDVLAECADPDLILFHQANKFMLDHLAKKMRLAERFPDARIPSNIDRFGNCSSASIPLLIATDCEEQVLRGAQVAAFGMGAGWQWAGAMLDMHDVEVIGTLGT